MKKASKITLIILAILLVVGLITYYKLGGFNTPEIKIVNVPAYSIAGKPYKGKMMSRDFTKLFDEADKYIADKTLSGNVCGVFYNNPQKETDTINAFIGIIMNDTTQKLPEGYSLRIIPARKVVRAHIKAHILVSPFIYPDMEEYAKKNKVESLQVPAIEIYPSNEEMIVEVPAK